MEKKAFASLLSRETVLFCIALSFPFLAASALASSPRPGNQKKGQAVRHCLKIFAEQVAFT